MGASAEWPGQERFDGMAENVNVGLDSDEATALASPILGTEMLVLLLKGLRSAFRDLQPSTRP